MAIKDILKISRKTFFNPRAWLGYDALKEQNRTIWSFVKGATAVAQPERTESFAEAMQRLNVSEEELPGIARDYFRYAIFFLALAVLDFMYGIYLLFHHHAFLGFILAFAVCILILIQAFKYHFWYFQIKHRKLGCTFAEWRQGKILEPETLSQDKAAQ